MSEHIDWDVTTSICLSGPRSRSMADNIIEEMVLGAIVGIFVVFVFESARNGSEKRKLRNVINGQYLRLKNQIRILDD